jgi:NTP pyrophosphatase (non-canonical NTP hydrolase)
MDQPDLSDPASLRTFYKQVLAYYGEDSQNDAIIEEAAELIHAICKYRHAARRGEGLEKAGENVVEEIADMQIALDQALLIFCGDTPGAESHFADVKKRKLAKLAEHISRPVQ